MLHLQIYCCKFTVVQNPSSNQSKCIIQARSLIGKPRALKTIAVVTISACGIPATHMLDTLLAFQQVFCYEFRPDRISAQFISIYYSISRSESVSLISFVGLLRIKFYFVLKSF